MKISSPPSRPRVPLRGGAEPPTQSPPDSGESPIRDRNEVSLPALVEGAAVGGVGGSLAGLLAGTLAGHPVVGLLTGAGFASLAGGGAAYLRELSRLDAQVARRQSEEENQRLREELQALRDQQPGNITLDLDRDLVRVQNLHTPEVLIDSFELHVPQVGSTVANAVKVSDVLQGSQKLPLESLTALLQGPLEVREGQVRLPEAALNTIASALHAPGISHLHLTLGEKGSLAITGQKDGFVDVPFELQTRIGREDDQRARLSLDKARVLGWIPVPKLITNILGSLAANKMNKLHLEQRGEDYLFNVAAFIPPNLDLKLGLKDLTTRRGDVVVNLGPCQASEAPPGVPQGVNSQ